MYYKFKKIYVVHTPIVGDGLDLSSRVKNIINIFIGIKATYTVNYG